MLGPLVVRVYDLPVCLTGFRLAIRPNAHGMPNQRAALTRFRATNTQISISFG